MKRRVLPRSARRAERGVTVLVVLVLLSVMLLGALAMARMSEVGTLATGNAAFRETALQASEVGLNEAFARVRAITDENTAVGNWYLPSTGTTDAAGLPQVDWSQMPQLTVGNYEVRYVVDRLCEGALPVAEPLRQCLVRQLPQITSADATKEKLDPPNAKQFRVTVRVTGPKGTQTFVQSMVTRG